MVLEAGGDYVSSMLCFLSCVELQREAKGTIMKIDKALKKKGVFLALLAISLFTMLYFGSQKEGYHVDEVYSYGLANSEYLPFMHFGAHDYNVRDWMMEYGPGESLSDLFRNTGKDYRILKE